MAEKRTRWLVFGIVGLVYGGLYFGLREPLFGVAWLAIGALSVLRYVSDDFHRFLERNERLFQGILAVGFAVGAIVSFAVGSTNVGWALLVALAILLGLAVVQLFRSA